MNIRNNIYFIFICCICAVLSTKAAQEGGYTPLHIAAFKNQLEVIKACGIDLETRTDCGYTPLSCAAMAGNIEFMKALIAEHVDIEARDSNGATPVFLAARWGKSDSIRLLHSLHADIEARDNDGRTPLHIAAMGDKKDAVIELLDAGADIEARDQRGRTALALACDFGHADIVHALIMRHADVNTQDFDGFVPFSIAAGCSNGAARERYENVLHELIIANKVTEKDGWTPLHTTAFYGLLKPTQELLLQHADIEARDTEYNSTPLMWACLEKQLPVVEELLKRGANVHTCNRRGAAASLIAAGRGQNKIIEKLLAAGALINDQRHLEKLTPLIVAAEAGHIDTVKLCLEEGANIDAADENGKTARDIATDPTVIDYLDKLRAVITLLSKAIADCDIPAIKELLIQRTPMWILTGDGTTAIHSSIGLYDPQQPTILDAIARMFIRHGGIRAVRARDSLGRTPLHIASLRGNLRLASLLVRTGAPVNVQDYEGNTPLHLAPAEFSAQQMRNRLLTWGADVSITNNQRQTPLSRNISLWHHMVDELLKNSQSPSKIENAHL